MNKTPITILIGLLLWVFFHGLGALSLEPKCSFVANGPAQFSETEFRDSAIEIEIKMTPHVMSLLTTPDATVGSYLEGAPIPDIVRSRARQAKIQNPKKLPWDSLSFREKIQVIQKKLKWENKTYYEKRPLTGLIIKDSIEVGFKEETSLFGVTYSPGKQLIDISSILRNVESCCNNEGKSQVSMIELHVRSHLSAGFMVRDTRKLLKALKIPANNMHIHIVSPLPEQLLRRKKILQTTKMIEFYRRTNLLSEFYGLFFHNKTIKIKQEKVVIERRDSSGKLTTEKWTDTFMAPITTQKLLNAARYLMLRGTRSEVELNKLSKMGWVGFFGHDKYDEPDLWGLEWRIIDKDYNAPEIAEMLDTIQRFMTANQHGISESQIKTWIRHKMGYFKRSLKIEAAFESLNYHQDWEAMLEHRSPALSEHFGGRENLGELFKTQEFQNLVEDRHQIKMLFFDWSNDPLVLGNQALVSSIFNSQLKAVQRLQSEFLNASEAENPSESEIVQDIMKQFLLESGIMQAVFESFGFDIAFDEED